MTLEDAVEHAPCCSFFVELKTTQLKKVVLHSTRSFEPLAEN